MKFSSFKIVRVEINMQFNAIDRYITLENYDHKLTIMWVEIKRNQSKLLRAVSIKTFKSY